MGVRGRRSPGKGHSKEPQATGLLVVRAHGYARGVRPGLICGNGGGVVKDMFYPLAAKHGAGVYLGRPGIRWPCVHVEDLARLYVLIAQKAAPGTAWNGVTDHITVSDLAAAVAGGK